MGCHPSIDFHIFQRVWNHQPVNPLKKTSKFQSFLEFESHEARCSWGLDDDFPVVSTIPQDRCASVCLFDSFPVNPTIYEILWFNSSKNHIKSSWTQHWIIICSNNRPQFYDDCDGCIPSQGPSSYEFLRISKSSNLTSRRLHNRRFGVACQ